MKTDDKDHYLLLWFFCQLVCIGLVQVWKFGLDVMTFFLRTLEVL
jgi:hypothetical protein